MAENKLLTKIAIQFYGGICDEQETDIEWTYALSNAKQILSKILEVVEGKLNDEWLEVDLAHKLEDVVTHAPPVHEGHYLYYKRHSMGIVETFKQAILKAIKAEG